jgi:hypothetical protein
MLRVTINQVPRDFVTLKIEGELCGETVPELDKAWRALAPSLGSRRLSVDLRGITFADSTGRRALAEIHSWTGAEFLADTPLTKHYAEQARQGIRSDSMDYEMRRTS